MNAGAADPSGATAPGVPDALPHEADGGWHRVHPLTPAVRSWQVVVVVLVVVAQDWGQAAARGERGPWPDGGPIPGFGVLPAVGGVGLAVLLVVVMAWLSWRVTRYRVTQDALELHHGVISRRQRRARLDRLQAVDVVQPLVARVVGLAKLSVEVAGGQDSKIELAYLTFDQAQQLRNHLLARAAGVRYDTVHAPEAPEHQMLQVPVDRLIGSLVLSGPTLLLTVTALGLAGATGWLRSPAPVAGTVPLLLGLGSLLWQRFARGFGFTAATSPDGLRLRHGLLEHRTQTVPPGRVQAVRMRQPLLWRRPDWWRVEVNVAGYGRGGDERRETESVLLPVGHREEAMAVVAFVLPDLTVAAPDDARTVVSAAMSGSGTGNGFVTCPRPARWLDPLAWRRNGFRVTEEALIIRRGWLHRQVDFVPHARTQSCGVRQGWLQRRLGVASFHLHSTPGPIVPVVPHLSTADAATLLAEQSERARRARAAAGPELWMEPYADGPAGPVADADQ
ncbi:MAG TPA: PH domain-containing protein [Kineosporiaceae bacterium]|nr:PH domain-containing protein [Kineosporiaceae bacterium]